MKRNYVYSYSLLDLSSPGNKKKKMMFATYQRSSSILQLQKKEIELKNSVNPGWVEPDLNYILLFIN